MTGCFKHTGKPLIPLTLNQQDALARLRGKMACGTYRFERSACACGACADTAISETDRYGLNLRVVICGKCGLARMDPRLDSVSLEGFYRNEYRDLYMGAEYGSMGNYFDGMVQRGRKVFDTVSRCRRVKPGMKVLEIGCSAGGLLVPFLEAGSTVKGYDYDARYLEYGRGRYPGLDLRLGGLGDLAKEAEHYDVIIMNHVLEHLPDPRGALAVARSKMNDRGTLYLSVPGIMNPEYYFSPVRSFLGGIHIAHLYYFSSATLKNLMTGFAADYVDETVCCVASKSDSKAPEAAIVNGGETDRIMTYIRRYERNIARRIFSMAVAAAYRWFSGGCRRMNRLVCRLRAAAVLRVSNAVSYLKCRFNPEKRWLFRNRSLRMDANLAVNDRRRRDFHLDRYKFAARFICDNRGPGLSILDAACGTGYGTDLLKGCDPRELVGVDICAEAVEYARKKYPGQSCSFIQADVTRLDGFSPGSFDAVVSFETIEHLEAPLEFLKNVHALLKTGGILIISTPNKWGKTRDHKFDYDYALLRRHIGEYFEIHSVYLQNSGCMDLWINRGSPRRLVPDSKTERETAECFIAVGIKR